MPLDDRYGRPGPLVTPADPDDPAVRLYRARGWRPLGLLSEESQAMVRPAPTEAG